MIKLRTFGHQSEAHVAKALLLSHGIEAKTLGAKVLVEERQFNKAKLLIDQMAKDMVLTSGDVDHFKKALKYALLAPIIVPVVFNLISLYQVYKYWESSEKDAEARNKVLFIVALQLLTVIALKYMMSLMGEFTALLPNPDDLN